MAERLIWLVPLAVGGLGLWSPRAGLAALAAALPLFGSPPGGPYLAALDVAGMAAIATAWRAGRSRPSALAWPAAAFVAVSLATLFPSPYQPPSWRPVVLVELARALPGVETWSALYGWRAAADLLLGWGLFLAVRRAFTGRSARPLATALLAGLVATLLLGLLSTAGWIDLGGYRPQVGAHPSRYRLQSLFFLSGWLAEYVVVAAPLALFALHRRAVAWRRLAPLLLAATLVALALTRQRGAWLAAAAQLALWAWWTAPRWWGRTTRIRRAAGVAAVVAGLTLVMLVASGSGGAVAERGRSIRSGLSARTPLWAGAVEMARQRPLMGSGLGSFTPAWDLAHPPGSPEARAFRGTAHNLYLHLAAERGLAGLAAFGLLCWALASCLARPRPGEEEFALALGLALAGMLVHGLVQYPFHLRAIAWLFWLVAGCAAVASRATLAPAASRAARALVALALAAALARPWLVTVPAYAGNRAFGLHETEAGGGHRWTEGYAAMRLPWRGEVLVLALANGHPRAGERPVEVAIGIDGAEVARPTSRGGWQEHAIQLGAPRREAVVLTLEARPAFRPFSDFRRRSGLPRSTDIRALGIAIREPRWRPAAEAASPVDVR